jgi:uncharacterized repeat protein (TIGR01451 family)
MKLLLSFFLGLLGILLSGAIYAAPSLLLDKRVSNVNPDPGETFRYTIRYRCASLTEHCEGAQIVDSVPSDLNIQSYSPASGNIATASDDGNNTITWTFTDPLPAGSTGALNINVNFPGCGDTQPSSVTNSATFSATNAATVSGDAPVVTMNGALSACPPPPPTPTSDFRKTMEPVRINGAANSRIYSDSSAPADYVVEDYFPAGMVITRLGSWSRGFEIQCGGTANWYTIPSNDQLHTPSDISGFNDCVSISAGPALSGADRGSEYFNITGLRYTVPQGNSSWFDIMYTVTESNPFTTAQLPNWTAGIVGNQIQNCAERMDTNVQACENGKIYEPELYLTGFKELFMSPETGWNDPKAGFNVPALIEDTSTSPPRTLGASDLVYYIAGGVNHQSSYDWVDPVFIELLEAPLSFDPAVNWWSVHFSNIGDLYLNPSYSLLNNPACNTPEFTVTENFANTGRTLLVWKFNGCTLHRNLQTTSSIRVAFSTTIKPGTPAGTLIENIAMFPIPPHIEPTSSDALYCTDLYSQSWAGIRDELDFDGNGDTSELLCKVGRPAYTVPVISEMNSSKYVQGKLDSMFDRYPTFGDTDQTGEGTYEMFIENGGNVNVTQFDVVDFLPFVGDTGVLSSNGSRDSTWDMQLADAITIERYNNSTGEYDAVPSSDLLDGEVKYSTSNNPCRFNGAEAFDNLSVTGDNPAGCTSLASGTATGSKSFGFRFMPTTPFAPGEKLKITVNVAISGTPPANSGDIAWNSFGYSGLYEDGGSQPLINSEPIKVGLRMVDTANRAALGDVVWFDTNHNGTQDAGEAGIENVTVRLYATDGTTLLDTAKTDSTGFYRFDNLDPSTAYIIKLDSASDYTTGSLAGLQLTLQNQGDDVTDNDASMNADGYPEISTTTNGADGNPTTAGAGTFTNTYDFGFWQPAALGNYVWYDVDGFGDQSGGELPVENMTVNLYDTDDNLIDTATTDASGFYLFDPLPADNYYLVFDKSTITGTDPLTSAAVNPADWEFTALNATGSPNDDSDVNGSGRTVTTVLEAGERDMSWDAGIKPYTPPVDPVSVGDYVWEDTNSNGVQDNGELGIEGVRVDLIEGGFPSDTTYTDNTGYYQFDNIERNTMIQIRFTPPAGSALTSLDQGGDNALDSDADPITGDTIQFALNPSIATTGSSTLDPTWDAGIINTTLSIGNQVWLDSNKDGLYSGGESGIAGLTVNLLGDATATTTTDSNGRYLFAGLAAGSYQVEVEIPSDLSATISTSNSSNPDSGMDNDHNGVDITSNPGFARSNVITLELGGGDLSEFDHGVAINGVTDSTLDRNADYTVDFGFIEGNLPCSLIATATVSSCTNVGNDADTSNDTFTLDVIVEGMNTGASTTYTYTSSSANISGSGTYSATAETDGPFVISATTSPFNLTITDSADNACTVSIPDLVTPSTCSSASPVELSVTKVADKTSASSGDSVTYTITVNNGGPGDATGVMVSDQLPVGITYSSHTESQGTYSEITGIWDVGNIANGASATLVINVDVD